MNKHIYLIAFFLFVFTGLYAQPERVGQAGATQLLINSWTKSAGFNGINVSNTDGIESVGINVAGLGSTTSTELVFSYTNWLMGSQISINTFGVSQALGANGGVMGLSVMAFSLGDFVRTTEAQPNGELGTFSPSYMNIGLSYARKFTEKIYVGLTGRIVTESTPDVRASGFAFDAGIQYRTGKEDRLKLGITLRNVGPTMKFAGDGLSGRVTFEPNNPFSTSVEIPTDDFELPSVLSIGGSYDFFLGDKHKIGVLGGFISNSFYYNQTGIGLQYQYSKYLMLRGSFLYEKGIFGDLGVDRYNAFTGAAVGATFQVPFKTKREDDDGNPIFSIFALDVAYRTTNPFNGTLNIGARIAL